MKQTYSLTRLRLEANNLDGRRWILFEDNHLKEKKVDHVVEKSHSNGQVIYIAHKVYCSVKNLTNEGRLSKNEPSVIAYDIKCNRNLSRLQCPRIHFSTISTTWQMTLFPATSSSSSAGDVTENWMYANYWRTRDLSIMRRQQNSIPYYVFSKTGIFCTSVSSWVWSYNFGP